MSSRMVDMAVYGKKLTVICKLYLEAIRRFTAKHQNGKTELKFPFVYILILLKAQPYKNGFSHLLNLHIEFVAPGFWNEVD